MNTSVKKLKRAPDDCQSDNSKGNLKISEKTRVKLKKERKIKREEDMSDEGNYKFLGEPSSKKIKYDPEKSASQMNSIKNENRKSSVSLWKDEEYLSASENINISVAKKIIELFDKENTIPFIARYRGHLIDHLTADRLRKIKSTYDYIELVHKKAEQLIKQVPSKELTSELIHHIQSARTVEELEFIGSHFKKESKKALAYRAKQLGLERPAELLLEGKATVKLEDFIKPNVPELKDTKAVKLGIQHIIAEIISKNKRVHDLLNEIYSSKFVLLKSKFKTGLSDLDKDSSKYQIYGDFSQSVTMMKPHQTLAINRGEAENKLTVKIDIPDSMWLPLKTFCSKTWLNSGRNYELRLRLFSDSVEDAIKRLLKPLAIRRIRAKLKAEAEDEALSVFGINLRQLLMTPPYSGHVVMGIDPGFSHGCKVAVVSSMGELLEHGKFFLKEDRESRLLLKKLVSKHDCNVIALGNGTACRETEAMLSNLIKRNVFKPYKVSYTIVNEQGVSIYSCSPAAREEFPNVDPKIVGAVSLARRLQNPLSELVKVEPKHLGVGMYQHDVREKKLESTLEDIVSECVSFVGVDINSASFHLLKRVAGLNAAKAREIIKHRTEVCSFKTREDLKKVKGIKEKTFQQCVGFIRVIPATARCRKHELCQVKFNPLDETCIHPESYDSTLKLIEKFGLNLERLGNEDFVEVVKNERMSANLEKLSKYCNCTTSELEFIMVLLSKTKDFDMRSLCPGPIFRTGILNMEDLRRGEILQGVVLNVVNFGAFVDVGVGHNGFIHISKMGNNSLQLNDRVSVEVINVTFKPAKIGLKLLSVIR